MSSQGYGFSSGHVWMWELDSEENWALKNWCFWSVVLEKTLESPLDCKEIQPVHPNGDKSWVFIGRTDAEAETPIFGLLMQKVDSLEKTLMLGGIGEVLGEGDARGWDDCMASLTQWTWVWWTPGVGDGQGGLACYDSGGRKESDTTETLNWTEWIEISKFTPHPHTLFIFLHSTWHFVKFVCFSFIPGIVSSVREGITLFFTLNKCLAHSRCLVT